MIFNRKLWNKILLKSINTINLKNRLVRVIQIKKCKTDEEDHHLFDEYLKKLNKYSPKPDSSCVCKRKEWNTKKEYILAIIVPVYNVEKYIEECLASLLNQKTVYKYQIILVNDGTKDNSIVNIQHMIHNDKIVYIEQKNKGLSAARNTGLNNINAEYVSFVDSDDYVADNFVQKLLDSAIQNKADIVQGGFYNVSYKNKIIKTNIFKEGVTKNIYGVSGYAWGKVIKTTLFEQVKFPEGYWFEDSIMSNLIYPMTKRIVIIPEAIYFYRRNRKGISKKSARSNKSIDSTWILGEMLSSREKLNLVNDEKYINIFLQQLIISYRREVNISKTAKKLVFIYSHMLVREYFKNSQQFELQDLCKHKLLLALLNNDFKAYKKLCTIA